MNKKGQETPRGVIIGGIILVAVFFFLIASIDKVDADKMGVMDRMGKVKGVMEPGLRWTGLFMGVKEYPMTIQKIYLERVEAVDIGGQPVYATIAVNYRIKRNAACKPEQNRYKDCTIYQLYTEVGRTGDMAFILDRLAIKEKVEEGFKQVSVKYDALKILENRDEVRGLAVDRIKELFPNEYFDIVSITISNIDFAPTFNAALQLKKDNEQLAIAAENKVKQAEAEANQAIQTARGLAESKKLDAEAKAYELKVQRQQITPLMIQKTYLEKWNGVLPKYMMGDSAGMLIELPAYDAEDTSYVEPVLE